MKRPSAASLKRVNAANLANLGAERLAEIMLAVADTRPELKRRLRMELAAEQGGDHLAAEIDKRLVSLETLTSKVSWRQRPIFMRDLDALRTLIADRMWTLDRAGALERMWRFTNLAKRVAQRVRDKHGEVDELFARAAADLAGLLRDETIQQAGPLELALRENPKGWSKWLPVVLSEAPQVLAAEALRRIAAAPQPNLILLQQQLADAAGDADAYRATFPDASLLQPANAAEVANRLLKAGRFEQAGDLLRAAHDAADAIRGKPTEPDFAWETSWIDYLDAAGRPAEAQAVRWQSFQRTLSVERAKAFTRRLKDFEDVEAEAEAFELASKHTDFQRGLAFLMGWPAVAEAGRMIEARPDDVRVEYEEAELWASQLRRIKPRAAHILLRKAAATAFKRRDFTTADRLTREADTIPLD